MRQLTERLECLRDIAVKNGLNVSEKRVKNKDKGRICKELQVGDKVMCRVPGVLTSLQDAWEGPYTVTKKCSKVNYKVKRDEGRGRLKLVLSNNLKIFQQREYDLLHVCIAEEVHIHK